MRPPSLGFPNQSPANYLQAAIAQILRSPYAGTPVDHYWATLAGDENFDKYGKPDWLGESPGQDASGVRYEPNPDNPLRGLVCKAPYRPQQDRAGIIYVAEFELYLPHDPGEVFVLAGDRPKRQDKFLIQGGVYYATAPVFPCIAGEMVAAFKISLSRERYPVRTDNGS